MATKARETVSTIAIIKAGDAFLLIAESGLTHVSVLTKFIYSSLDFAVVARILFVIDAVMIIVAVSREVNTEHKWV